MSTNGLTSNSFSAIMKLQDFCSRTELKKPTSFLVQDLLPVPYSQVSPANSVTSSSCTTDSSPNQSIQSISPELSERDSSHEPGSLESRDQSPPMPKKNRSSFSSSQICELERIFEKQQYLGTRERQQLALALRMTDQQVKTWFQNRRMKRKRKRSEETQYYTKLAFANRMVSGPPQQAYFPSYQPQMYSGYTGYPPVMPPSYQSLPLEHQSLLRPPSSPLCPGIELSHPISPPPEYPGLRMAPPSLCRECPGPECNRACTPHFGYPSNMPMFSPPDYSVLH